MIRKIIKKFHRTKSLVELIESKNLEKIIKKGLFDQLLKEAEKNEDALYLVLDSSTSEKPEVQEKINTIVRSGKRFAVLAIIRPEIRVPITEKLSILLEAAEKGIIEPGYLSHPFYQEMCDKDSGAKKALIRFYLSRAEEIIKRRKNYVFSKEDDYEIGSIMSYLKEIPIPEVQEFIEREKPLLKHSEKEGY